MIWLAYQKKVFFLKSLVPNVDVVMLQEHKLRGKNLDHLGRRLLLGSDSWILEVAPREKSRLNPHVIG